MLASCRTVLVPEAFGETQTVQDGTEKPVPGIWVGREQDLGHNAPAALFLDFPCRNIKAI